MFKTINNKKKKEFKEIKFNHLMSIYELNYHNLKQVLNFRSQKNFQRSKINKNLIIDDVYQDKFTRIFKMYHKFSYDEQLQTNTTFSIKPHLIFYMYEDAQLLEVKSLKDNRMFESTMSHKIKLNLNLFYWLKNYINQ
jgi:uncharacterized protein YqiB (DUF1249 family)|tara:strand:- start:564 stop:977 length:414 start_codon:yes stop_codon:yes gene_type:complete